MRLLVDGLGFQGSWRNDWTVPTTETIAQARQRLGTEPLRVLLERVVVPCAQRTTRGAWLGSRGLIAVDGFVLDVAAAELAVAYQERWESSRWMRCKTHQRGRGGVLRSKSALAVFRRES